MAKNKGRKPEDDPNGDDDGDDDEEEEPSARTSRDSIDRIFAGSNWRREVESTVRELERKNERLLRKNREQRQRITTLEEAQPDDEAVVLSKDDAAVYADFKKLNLKPADITAALTERDTLKAKDAERENETIHQEAAEALGYPNVAALSKALKREKLHVEMRSVRQDDPENPGKKILVSVPYVRPADKADAQPEPLSDYIDREISELETAFLAEPAKAGDDGEEDGDLVGAGAGADSARGESAGIRRITAEATGGVRIPVTRNARPANGAAREARIQEDALQKKRSAGGYRL